MAVCIRNSILKLTSRNIYFANQILSNIHIRNCSIHRNDDDELPEPVEDSKHYSAYSMKEKGKIYDKKPFKFKCYKGRTYMWCSCGYSNYQPFCDGTHRLAQLNIKLKPCKFVPTETKEYWFCNCKQTNNRPFCDGSHRQQNVQEAIK
ncbi:CISD3 (predicted) [Pycnogonum litorale]